MQISTQREMEVYLDLSKSYLNKRQHVYTLNYKGQMFHCEAVHTIWMAREKFTMQIMETCIKMNEKSSERLYESSL